MADGRGQGAFDGPSVIDTGQDRHSLNPSQSRPLSQCVCGVIQRQTMIRPFVILLFNRTRPTAIIRSVWAIIVNAIQRMTDGTTAHISQEVRETIKPLWAQDDAAATVGWIAFVVRIVTATLRMLPADIFAALVANGRFAMFDQFRAHAIDLQAPARLSITTTQVGLNNRQGIATVALAKPCTLVAFSRFDIGRQPSESYASKIHWSHSGNYITRKVM